MSYAVTIQLIFLLVWYTNGSYAAQGIASSGHWGSNSTWSFNGVNRLPTCGDTLLVPTGSTVTVNNQYDYISCNEKILVFVDGILQFNNGFKIDFPCSSLVVINLGGELKKSTPGFGNSTLINICNCLAWNADQGIVNGPRSLSCNPLPVSLLFFSTEESDEGIKLFWETASETNNQFFSCERSINGKDFFSIGKIKGAGNSSVKSEYSLLDKNPNPGKNYYRLKQIDFDGKFSFSETVSINNKSSGIFTLNSLFINEDKYLNLSLQNARSEIQIQIYDLSGRIVYAGYFHGHEDRNVITLPLEGISPGSYMLFITNGLVKKGEMFFLWN
jgi:hypothetical protein